MGRGKLFGKLEIVFIFSMCSISECDFVADSSSSLFVLCISSFGMLRLSACKIMLVNVVFVTFVIVYFCSFSSFCKLCSYCMNVCVDEV